MEKVKNYMDSHNISEISASVCRDYLLNEFGNRDSRELTIREKEVVSNVNILIEFLETGAVQFKKEQLNLDGPIGTLMLQYLVVKKDQRLHKSTISIHECHLSRFPHIHEQYPGDPKKREILKKQKVGTIQNHPSGNGNALFRFSG